MKNTSTHLSGGMETVCPASDNHFTKEHLPAEQHMINHNVGTVNICNATFLNFSLRH